MMTTMGAVFVGCAILLVWGRAIIRLWAGPAAVPSQILLSFMCLWILISTFMANTATVLAATSHIRLQARLSLLAAALNLAASIWLVQKVGSIGVLLGTIGSYLLVLIVPQTLQTIRILRIPSVSEVES
jgi:O-antigen/teichoic acid export membrane protein